MENSLFFQHINENELNRQLLIDLEKYVSENHEEQVYVVNSALGEKYSYSYQENVMVILSPKHKLIFLDLAGNDTAFDEFYDDFVEDLNSISDKYKYKDYIGRPREWKRHNTVKIYKDEFVSFERTFRETILVGPLQRVSELLISLLIGSINDIDKVGVDIPDTLLEKVKKNIILFDGEQTRFIYKEYSPKIVTIQGLSGTGKTELLLHKLKEIYLKEEDAKIFFTCHSITLSNLLRERIPSFFNFMKVEKQIEWNSKLWVTHAWGSRNYPNSGFYSYLCHFYKVPFLRYSSINTYEKIFKQILDHVDSLPVEEFEYALDYVFIDERQDFPDILFKLCERVVKKKVYIAGDIFQDIFENTQNTDLEVDIVLNRCYRTDPRTLMFAHAIGLGLFENKKLNWFTDSYWNSIGYQIDRYPEREVHLLREPIRRFDNLSTNEYDSVVFRNSTYPKDVIAVLQDLKDRHPDLQPDDVAIILMEENRQAIYNYIDSLIIDIGMEFGWKANRAYENKKKIPNTLYISNSNNIKGLEFPFAICLTAKVQNTYKYRNLLYTMLTRSFIQSYLMVTNADNLDSNLEGLATINQYGYIKTVEPTDREKKEIQNRVLKLNESYNQSYEDFISEIFDALNIEHQFRERFITALLTTEIERFDKKKTIKFIKANKEFFTE